MQAGTFNSDAAHKIGERLLEAIAEYGVEKYSEGFDNGFVAGGFAEQIADMNED